MSAGWQEFVLYLVFAAGTAVSLFAFMWGRRVKRSSSAPRAVREDPAFAEYVGSGMTLGGETEVTAPDPKALLDILAVHLDNPANYMNAVWAGLGKRVGQMHVERTNDQELSFTTEGLNIAEGLVRAEAGPVSGSVRVRFSVRLSGGTGLITAGQVWALLLGVPVSIIVPAVIFTYVLGSSNPAVRGQFMQVIQVGQVLWEPFLLIGIGTQRLKWSGRHLEMLIAAAAFEARTGRPATAAVPSMPQQR
jgi:hypothetical protein